MAIDLGASISALGRRQGIPDADELSETLSGAIRALESAPHDLRPPGISGRPGGLLVLSPSLPTMVLPDLHARHSRLALVLESPLAGGLSPLDALASGTLQVVCLGDALHSERRGAARWAVALGEFSGGFASRQAMNEEMAEGIALSMIVMKCLAAFPKVFAFLKGNHENVWDEEGGGNHRFRKFALEGEMTRAWFLAAYGPEILEKWSRYESLLPLVVVGGNFVASHAEPARAFSRREIVSGGADAVEGLTWTDNGRAEEGSVAATMSALLGGVSGNVWFSGHRPVRGNPAPRAGGLLVQIHDPDAFMVALARPGRPFDAGRDILRY